MSAARADLGVGERQERNAEDRDVPEEGGEALLLLRLAVRAAKEVHGSEALRARLVPLEEGFRVSSTSRVSICTFVPVKQVN